MRKETEMIRKEMISMFLDGKTVRDLRFHFFVPEKEVSREVGKMLALNTEIQVLMYGLRGAKPRTVKDLLNRLIDNHDVNKIYRHREDHIREDLYNIIKVQQSDKRCTFGMFYNKYKNKNEKNNFIREYNDI